MSATSSRRTVRTGSARPREAFRFRRRGFQRIERDPGWVRIFQCRHCGRYFRDSCFGPEYRARRSGLGAPVFQGLVNGQAKRQIARALGISRRCVDRIERGLARQCLLYTLNQLPKSMVELYEGRAKARPHEQIRVAGPVFAD